MPASSANAVISSLPFSSFSFPRPNFLIILVDDLDVELGSASSEAMPVLHELLVSQGLNFSAAHVTSPICCPSRTSLFSGRYPHNLGDDTLGWCGNFTDQREDNFLTALGRSGYAVQQVGKWYNEEDTFCKPGYVPAWKKGAQGDASDSFLLCNEGVYFDNTFNDNGVLVKSGADGYMTAVLGNRSLNWLINASASAGLGAGAGAVPFISYVGFHSPHLPATPAPWYENTPVPTRAPRTPAWNTGWQDKHWVIDNGIDKPMSADLINGSDVLHAQRLRTLLSVDDFLRDAVAALEKAGTLENTFIIFSSDHGYHLGQWGLWSEKAMPFDHDTHIPLIIRGPNIVPGSMSSELVAMNIDLGPTILELAGIPNQWPSVTGVRDGKSLVQLLTATTPTPGWRERMLIEFVGWVAPYEWLRPCQFGLAPWTNCTINSPAGLINGQSNRWTALRIINASKNTLIADFRAPLSPLQRDSTNFTEIYDITDDAEFIVNLAVKGRISPEQISLFRDELWAVAACTGVQCP
jgi:N-acetylglucosamine-6-sulfatase